MCRLFGMHAGAQPLRATFWLLDAPDNLRAQSHRNPDGTGLGWYDQDRPVVEKQPLAAYDDTDFAGAAKSRESRTFVAHIRHASTGGISAANTHPFEQAGRIFAHNGALGGLTELESHLGDDLSLVHGDTDSERFFALLTREIDRRGSVESGIATAVGWLAEHVPVLSLNFVLISADSLWALRYPDARELWVLDEHGGKELTSSHGTRVDADRSHSVVVASEPLDDESWRLLEPGTLLRVGPDLATSETVIHDRPPREMVPDPEPGNAHPGRG